MTARTAAHGDAAPAALPRPEQLVQAQLEAYNRQDIEAFLAVYHDDCEFVRWGGKVEMRGHDAWRPRYLKLWAGSPRLQAKILNRIIIGRRVIDLEQLENAVDGPRRPLVVIYEVEGAKIRRVVVMREESRGLAWEAMARVGGCR